MNYLFTCYLIWFDWDTTDRVLEVLDFLFKVRLKTLKFNFHSAWVYYALIFLISSSKCTISAQKLINKWWKNLIFPSSSLSGKFILNIHILSWNCSIDRIFYRKLLMIANCSVVLVELKKYTKVLFNFLIFITKKRLN